MLDYPGCLGKEAVKWVSILENFTKMVL